MKPKFESFSEKTQKVWNISFIVIRKVFGVIFAFLALIFTLLVFVEDEDTVFLVFLVTAFSVAAGALLKPHKEEQKEKASTAISGVKVIERLTPSPSPDSQREQLEPTPVKALVEPVPMDASGLPAAPTVQKLEDKKQHDSSECAADDEDLFKFAVTIVAVTQKASVSELMQRLNLSYSSAWSLLERMERIGIISAYVPSQPREVLITLEEWLDVRTRDNVFAMLEARQSALSTPPSSKRVSAYEDNDGLITDQHEWRRKHMGLSQIDYELMRIDCMQGAEFETWCSKLLTLSGFKEVKPTPASGDQGVDILAEMNGVKYAIQCKCYSGDLGNKPVQEVYAGKMIYNCHVGVVVTNRHFTSGGKAAASATGVLLWDRDTLVDMLEPLLESDYNRKQLRLQNDM